MPKQTQYTVSDGKLVLNLEPAVEGGYIVTSPMEPGLTTQAETLAEAFEAARDAIEALREARTQPNRRRQGRASA